MKLGEHGLALDAELLRQLVYAGLACHCTPHSEVGGQLPLDLTLALEGRSFCRLHRVLMSVVLPCWSGVGGPTIGCFERLTNSLSGPVSTTPATRNARPKARRRSAIARQVGSGCRCAPRPGCRRSGSGSTLKTASPDSFRLSGSAPFSTAMCSKAMCLTATTRSNSKAGARLRQPTQVRTGDARLTTAQVYPAYAVNASAVLLALVQPEAGPSVITRPAPALPVSPTVPRSVSRSASLSVCRSVYRWVYPPVSPLLPRCPV